MESKGNETFARGNVLPFRVKGWGKLFILVWGFLFKLFNFGLGVPLENGQLQKGFTSSANVTEQLGWQHVEDPLEESDYFHPKLPGYLGCCSVFAGP